MKRLIFRAWWSYIAKQLEDVAKFLQKKWKGNPPSSIEGLRQDIHSALREVLYHGRVVD